MKKAKTIITGDQGTFLNIGFIACTVREILEQYNTSWMPADIKKVYKRMIEDSNKLEVLAERKSKVEYK